jgi:hypothetical protein
MGDVWEEIKGHPYIFGGAVAALVLAYYFLSKPAASSSGQAGLYAYSQDPNVTAANAQQAISQNQTNATVTDANTAATAAVALQTIQTGGALAAVQSNNDTSIQLAGLQAQTAQQANALSYLTSLNTTAANYELNSQYLNDSTGLALASMTNASTPIAATPAISPGPTLPLTPAPTVAPASTFPSGGVNLLSNGAGNIGGINPVAVSLFQGNSSANRSTTWTASQIQRLLGVA